MKIGVFTDSHYSSKKVTCETRYCSKSLIKIKKAYDCFKKEKCELVVCLGDLIDTENTIEKEIENLKSIAKIINSSPIPTVCLMGNHDAFVLTPKDFYSYLNINPPKDISQNGLQLIFLDACYFKNGKHYAPGDSEWKDCFLKDEKELEEKLKSSKDKTYIFIHQNINPAIRADHRIYNGDKVFKIINSSEIVDTVFEGHYHPGNYSVYNGVKYVTLPAMCETEDGFSIIDL